MNKISYILIFSLLNVCLIASAQFPISPNLLDSQKRKTGHWTILCDSNFRETKNLDSVVYYRTARFEAGKPVGKVRDFYASGKKQWDGYLLSVNPDTSDGEAWYYYENGKLSQYSVFDHGRFNGVFKTYFLNGNLKAEGIMRKDTSEGEWKYYYENGQLQSHMMMKKGQTHGFYFLYHENGQLHAKGQFLKNEMTGYWEFFHPNGKLKSKENYLNGLLNGAYETYSDQGIVTTKGTYKNNEFVGIWQYYHDNGKVKCLGKNSEDGKKIGEWKYFDTEGHFKAIENLDNGILHGAGSNYYPNGKIQDIGNYVSGFKNGLYKNYFENGNLQKYGYYQADSLVGLWTYYYESGKKKAVGKYVDNKKDSVWNYYFEDGSLDAQETFSMGILDGNDIEYFPNGQLKIKTTYSKGFKNGHYQSYYENGNLESEGNYILGQKNGEWKNWYENGAKEMVGSYLNGQKEGEWKWYFQNGLISYHYFYQDGQKTNKSVEYYDNGNKKIESEVKNGQKEGFATFYSRDGSVYSQGNYLNGERSGKWFFNDSITHKKASEGVYLNGNFDGKWNLFDEKGKVKKVNFYQNGFWETCGNVSDSIDILTENQEYDKALAKINLLEKVLKRDKFEKSSMASLPAFHYSTIYFYQKKYEKSREYSQKYAELILKYDSDTVNNYAVALNSIARNFSALKKYEEAVIYYDKSLKIYERLNKRNSENYTNILLNKALVYSSINKLEQGEKILLDELKWLEDSFGKNQSETFNCLLSIAYFYKYNNKKTESLEYYQTLQKACEDKRSDYSKYYKDATRECAYLLHLFERDNEALDQIKLLISISEENTIQYLVDLKSAAVYYGSLSKPDTAKLIYDYILDVTNKKGWQNTDIAIEANYGLAIHYASISKYELAFESYKRVIKHYESKKDTENELFANILHAYGYALFKSDNSKIEEALKYYQRCVDIKKRKLGETDVRYINSLTNLSDLYTQGNRFSEAEKTATIAFDIAKKTFGENNFIYSNCLTTLAYIKTQQNLPLVSNQFYKEASLFYQQHPERYFSNYMTCLNSIAVNFSTSGRYDSAIYYSQKAVDTYRTVKGENQIEFLSLNNTLASMYEAHNRISEAEQIYLKNEKQYLQLLGNEHLLYATSLRDLGHFYGTYGNNRKAKIYYSSYIQLIEKISGKTSDYYIYALSALAKIHLNDENYIESERLFKEAFAIVKIKYGTNDVKYAEALSDLGKIFYYQKRYNESENYYLQAIAIYLNVFGSESKQVADIQNDYASVCTQLDKNKEAEEIYQHNVEVFSKTTGTDSYYYLNALNELSNFYVRFGQFAEAERIEKEEIEFALKKDYKIIIGHKLYKYASLLFDWKQYKKADSVAQQALSIYEDILERNNVSILNTRNLLGLIALEQSYLTKAKEHFQFCVYETKAKKVENSNLYGIYLNNLGKVELEQNNYLEAEKLFKQAGTIFDKTVKKGSLQDISHLDNFAALYQVWGKNELAEKYWLEVNKKLLTYIKANFYFMSDNEKAQFWQKNGKDIEDFNTYATIRSKQNQAILGEMYNNQLATKGILLSASNKIKKRILASRDTSLINEYHLWRGVKEQLAKAYLLSETEKKEQKINISSLESSANKLEKSLNITVQDLDKENVSVTWKDIQKVLSKNEAVIEIVRYRYFDKHQTDSVLYAALILTTETKANPILVVLPNGAELEGKALKYYKNAIRLQLEDQNSYQSYWAPIAKYLKNKSKVYISFDGVYNSINMNTLQISKDAFLIDSLELKIVSNTKDILDIKATKQILYSKPTATLFGFPTYFIGNKKFDKNQKQDTDRSGISELPGTKVEIEKIEAILTQSNWTSQYFMAENASESALKSVQNPRILHIATHGMFVDDKSSTSDNKVMNRWQSQQNPLLKVGLLLSGAANYFQDETVFSSENGILTAYEAANLHLENTDLVILSACETGKGEIRNGEGVYGMQRAFQTAGAKAIVMSLWKVDDNATQQLMTSFYTYWMKGMEKQLAFKTAQLEIKKQFIMPYYWGAFVLVGN